MKSLLLFSALVIGLACAAPAFTWNESISGDLSGDGLAPTPLTLDVGVNHISGTMGSDLPQVPPDRDIFTFTLAPGQLLTSINVEVFTPTNQSFFAISGSNTIDITNPVNHLSNTLVKGVGEILDDLDAGSYSGGLGLTAPLVAGTYTVWFQELSSIVTYDIAYTVQTVPEPGTALWSAVVGIFAGARRLRARVA